MKKISFETPDFDERGVSPVIGVILMVAITVILAAVIASFVLGFGDSVSENVQAGADVSETDDGDATVTWISEGNAENLSVTAGSSGSVNLTEVGQSATITYDSSVSTGTDQTNREITIGSGSQTVQVTVTAVGSGGSRTVVTQEEVELTDDNA